MSTHMSVQSVRKNININPVSLHIKGFIQNKDHLCVMSVVSHSWHRTIRNDMQRLITLENNPFSVLTAEKDISVFLVALGMKRPPLEKSLDKLII